MQSKLKPYRGPSFRYKIKQVTTNNKTGDSYAINIPKVVAEMFGDIQFNLFIAGSNIIFSSGCKLEKDKELNIGSRF